MSVQIGHHFVVIDLIRVFPEELFEFIRILLQAFNVFDASPGDFADLFLTERKSVDHLVRHLLIPPDLGRVISLYDPPLTTVGADSLTPVVVRGGESTAHLIYKLFPFDGVIRRDHFYLLHPVFYPEHIRQLPGIVINSVFFGMIPKEFL